MTKLDTLNFKLLKREANEMKEFVKEHRNCPNLCTLHALSEKYTYLFENAFRLFEKIRKQHEDPHFEIMYNKFFDMMERTKNTRDDKSRQELGSKFSLFTHDLKQKDKFDLTKRK
jgi:hypothetical protein